MQLTSIIDSYETSNPYLPHFEVKLNLAAGWNFFRSNSLIFEPKVEKICMGVFSTHFVPLISILAPKIMKE